MIKSSANAFNYLKLTLDATSQLIVTDTSDIRAWAVLPRRRCYPLKCNGLQNRPSHKCYVTW